MDPDRLTMTLDRVPPPMWTATDASVDPDPATTAARAVLDDPVVIDPVSRRGGMQLLAGVADMAREVAQAALAASALSDSAALVLDRFVDDLNSPSWPRWWPFERPEPTGGPEPEWQIEACMVLAAKVLAGVGSTMGDITLRDAFSRAASRLLDTALAG